MDANLIRIIREPEVRRRTGLSHASIFRMREAGQFPQPVKVGARATGWLEHEINAWLQSRILAREVA